MAGIVVYDLEYTAWEGSVERRWSGAGEYREIVQIGAVRLDSAWREERCFNVLVRPQRNPILSAYFMALTGLSQQRLDIEGGSLAEGLSRLAQFAAPDALLMANGHDADIIFDNCRLAGITPPLAKDRFVDISGAISHAAGRDGHVISATLPGHFDFETSGPAHDGLADARAVAGVLARVPAAWELALGLAGKRVSGHAPLNIKGA